MLAATYPLQVLLMTFSGLVNRHQADVIAYLAEEDRVLKEQLKGRTLRLTDDQRRRLASKAKILGRKALNMVATIVTPDTLMRWPRQLIAAKWTFQAKKRVGRPGLMRKIKALIVRMALANPSWGYCRIQGELNRRCFSGEDQSAPVPLHGQNVTSSPSERLNPDGPPAASRYQNWKFQVEPAVILPSPELAGGFVKSTRRETRPRLLVRTVGFKRKISPPTQRTPSPKG